AVGDCIRTFSREYDIACRCGGEEFVILLPGASAQAAAARGEELRGKIEALALRHGDGALPRVTISVGVAVFSGSGQDLTDVLRIADEALYRAKHRGRNRVELASGGASP